jgi:hypothetical protein
MTREEPSLETLWLQNIGTMDLVQIIDHSNTVPLSKTFRDPLNWFGHRLKGITTATLVEMGLEWKL